MPPGAPFPAGFTEGVARFNQGEFFEAHEAFEDLLEAVESDERWDLLVALIQIAVGYHKAASGHPGAERMLGLGSEKLTAFPTVTSGVDVPALRRRVSDDLARLTAGQPLRDPPPRIELV
jgi:uncharacterized protein